MFSAVAVLVLASSASAATTLSAAASPTQGGTPTAPAPVVTTLATTIDNNAKNPIAQTSSLVQTLPAEFANQLAKFGSCPESQFNGATTAPGQPGDPTVSCPPSSIVGNGLLESFAAIGPGLVAKSQKVVIVRNATTGGLSFWDSFEAAGLRVSKILPGTVTTGAGGATVITWDPTPLETIPQIKLLEFDTAYNVNSTAPQPLEPFASTGCAGGSWAFSVVNDFVGAPSQTATASVPCGAASAAPANTALPTIKGKAKVGSKLTASDGSWTGNPAPTLTRQWQSCNEKGNKCKAVKGATGTTYKVKSGDVGHTIQVVVTATNPAGTVTATSHQSAVVPSGSAKVGAKTVKVSGAGKGRFALKCNKVGPCSGKFKLKAGKSLVSKGSFKVSQGKNGKVSFKLNGKGKSLLEGSGKLKVKLQLIPVKGKTVKSNLTLKSS